MDSHDPSISVLSDLLDRNRRVRPAAECLIDPPDRARVTGGAPQRLTWRSLGERVDRLALTLARQGLVRGDIVVTVAPTLHETLVAQLACVSLGLVTVGAPVQYREAEVGGLIARLKPRALIGHARLGSHANARMLADLAATSKPALLVLAHGADIPDGVVGLDAAADQPLTPPEAAALAAATSRNRPEPDDLAFIVFTSGTSATPKAVPRTHREILALAPFLQDVAGLPEGGTFLSPRMLNTVGAIANGFVSWLYSAARMVLHHPFDLDVFLHQIAKERPEVTSCPPAILNIILKRLEAGERVDLGGLHHITSGSAQLNPRLVRLFQDRFGIALVNSYGSSEGAMLIASERDFSDPEDRAQFFPRLGPGHMASKLGILRGYETRIVDPATGVELTEPGQAGELRFKGPMILRAYWDAAAETAAAFDADGWFRTGDIFAIDGPQGRYLRFVGRLKNIIVRGGLNISAEEVQDLALSHPAVIEAVAVPVPDPTLGEKIGLAVVLRPGTVLTLEVLTAHLREVCKVAVVKLPEHLRVLEALPVLPSGKTDIAAVRALYSQIAAQGGPR